MLFAHTPSGTALSVLECLNELGYRFDVILYQKYPHSNYIDPHDEKEVPFKKLSNRFPSIPSLGKKKEIKKKKIEKKNLECPDFLQKTENFDSFGNLYLMHLYNNMMKYSFNWNYDKLIFQYTNCPLSFNDAHALATQEASSKSKGKIQKIIRAFGIKITNKVDSTNLLYFDK